MKKSVWVRLECPHCRANIFTRSGDVVVVVPPVTQAVVTTTCRSCQGIAWAGVTSENLAWFALTDAVIVAIPTDEEGAGPPITWDDVLDVRAELDALPTSTPGDTE